MTGDPGMLAQLCVERAARAGHDVHVDLVGRQRFRVVLHAGTSPQISEHDRRHARASKSTPVCAGAGIGPAASACHRFTSK